MEGTALITRSANQELRMLRWWNFVGMLVRILPCSVGPRTLMASKVLMQDPLDEHLAFPASTLVGIRVIKCQTHSAVLMRSISPLDPRAKLSKPRETELVPAYGKNGAYKKSSMRLKLDTVPIDFKWGEITFRFES